MTTGGGLYRYRLGDRVRVTGLLGRTPSLRFLGRQDAVSDRFGEKLNDAHVAGILERVIDPRFVTGFTMLAPDSDGESTGYTLYIETASDLPGTLAAQLDRELTENVHYAHCRRLGQLGEVRVFRIVRDARSTYRRAALTRGQRLGEVKEAALSPRTGWSKRFDGHYVGSRDTLTLNTFR